MWWSKRYEAFISYSHKDNDVVKPLVELLSVNEHRVFWDQNLKAGDRWDDTIRSSIKHSGIFVLFWCCDTSGSEYVAEEVALALRLKKKIVPVKLCAAAMPSSLGEWQWIDLRQRVQHLCTDVDHQPAGISVMEARPLSAPRAPKRWLVPLATACALLVCALLVLSAIFFELRGSKSGAPGLQRPASVEVERKGIRPPEGSAPPVGGSGTGFPQTSAAAPAPPWYRNRAILFLAGVLAVAIAWLPWTLLARRRRASHTLRITMDYLRRLQHGG